MSLPLDINLLRQLLPEDFKLLEAVERHLPNFQFVPERYVIDSSGLRADKALFRLRKLAEWRFIWHVPREALGYVGYTLNYAGLDALAIREFTEKNQISAMGKPLGIGKEADVLDALNPKGRRVAIKFHRLGRTSFRQTRRGRGYDLDQEHYLWITQSKKAAEREFQALKILHKIGVDVPKPYHWNRHAIIMSFIDGVELYRTHPPNPAIVLRQILRNVRKAYQKAALIHGDLSHFNVVIKRNGTVLIIDWPQCVDTRHPNAQEILDRDLTNVLGYLKRTYRISFDKREALDYVVGFRRRPPAYLYEAPASTLRARTA